MVGSLNWTITIGRFDIQYAGTTLARYSHAPREGHLKAVIRVFGYLKKFHKGKLLIDPTLPVKDSHCRDKSLSMLTLMDQGILRDN